MNTVSSAVRAETEALRLLREGYSPGQIFDKTGVTKQRLTVIATLFGGSRPPAPPVLARTITVTPAADPIAELIEDGKQARSASVRQAAARCEKAIQGLRDALHGAVEREKFIAEQEAAKQTRAAERQAERERRQAAQATKKKRIFTPEGLERIRQNAAIARAAKAAKRAAEQTGDAA